MFCQQCFENEAEICRDCRNKDFDDYEKKIRKLEKMITVRDVKIKQLSLDFTFLNENL